MVLDEDLVGDPGATLNELDKVELVTDAICWLSVDLPPPGLPKTATFIVFDFSTRMSPAWLAQEA